MARGTPNRANLGTHKFSNGPSKSRTWARDRGTNSAGLPTITFSAGGFEKTVTLLECEDTSSE